MPRTASAASPVVVLSLGGSYNLVDGGSITWWVLWWIQWCWSGNSGAGVGTAPLPEDPPSDTYQVITTTWVPTIPAALWWLSLGRYHCLLGVVPFPLQHHCFHFPLFTQVLASEGLITWWAGHLTQASEGLITWWAGHLTQW